MSTDTLSQTRSQAKTPPLYKVLLLNDDYTPMEFVLYVLMRFFRKGEAEASRVMLEAHQKGTSVAGVYPYEVAETKVAQVTRHAQQEGHPLRLELEAE